jgi:hypothetical protein
MAARKLPLFFAVLLAVSVGFTAVRVGLAPAGAATGDSVVLAWNQQVLDTIQQTRLGPTIAVRALAVVHTASYDAWAAYDAVAVPTWPTATAGNSGRAHPGQQEQGGQLRRLCRPGRSVPGPPDCLCRAHVNDLGYVIDGSDTSRRPRSAATPPRPCWGSATATVPTSSATSPAAPLGCPTRITPATRPRPRTPGTRSATRTAGSRCASPPRRPVPPAAPAASRPT